MAGSSSSGIDLSPRTIVEAIAAIALSGVTAISMSLLGKIDESHNELIRLNTEVAGIHEELAEMQDVNERISVLESQVQALTAALDSEK